MKKINLVVDTHRFSFTLGNIRALLLANGCKNPDQASVIGTAFVERDEGHTFAKMDIVLSFEH